MAKVRTAAKELMGEAGSVIVAQLESLLDEQISAKELIEQRWLEDLRRYHGQYEQKELDRIKAKGGCQLFANVVRPKTNAWEARLVDVLFPSDDKNWGIEPTPMPDLDGMPQPSDTEDLFETPEMGEELEVEMPMEGMPPEGMPPEGMPMEGGQPPAPQQPPAPKKPEPSPMDIARRAASAMEKLIEDQLTEGNFNAICRSVVRDACRYGTGVLKGPVMATKAPKKWGMAIGGPLDGQFVQAPIEGQHPEFICVSPWDFFPDMAAPSVRESEFFFERHTLGRRDLRKLSKTPGFDSAMLKKVISMEPSEYKSDKRAERQAIDGMPTSTDQRKYTVWEYRGPLDHREAMELGTILGKLKLTKYLEDTEIDVVNVVVWFVEGVVINIGINPMDDDEEPAYAVFNFVKNETNVFGYGVPYLLKDVQDTRNAAWRMLIDNAALSVGPQIVINKDIIAPEDGHWGLTPHKIWMATNNMAPVNAAFASFSVDGHQQELLNVINQTQAFADDEINMPELASGGSGSHQTVTAQGMSILQNNAAIPLRNLVKSWDDDVTVPVITRCFNWNMQFSELDEVKGDAKVRAKGSTVLVVREMHAQSLMAIANQFGAHPVFGPLLKPAELLRQIMRMHMIPWETIVKSDDDVEYEQATAQPQPSPEEIKGQIQQQIAQLTAESKTQAAQIAEQGRVQAAQLAAEVAREKTQANIQIADADRQAKIQIAQINHDGTMQQSTIGAVAQGAALEQKDRELNVKASLALKEGQKPGGLFPG